MKRALNSYQIGQWYAVDKITPFLGHKPAWARSATIAATIANVFRGKNSSPIKMATFMPPEPERMVRSTRPQKTQSVEAQKSIVAGFTAWAKGKGLIRKKR